MRRAFWAALCGLNVYFAFDDISTDTAWSTGLSVAAALVSAFWFGAAKEATK